MAVNYERLIPKTGPDKFKFLGKLKCTEPWDVRTPLGRGNISLPTSFDYVKH
jgi:hypothetical protein